GLDLYPFQRAGAIAAAAGHGLFADDMGLGKTRQALATLAIRGARRTLLVVPPVVLTHWAQQTSGSGLFDAPVVLHARRKDPVLADGDGAVVVSDSLLVARPHLVDAIRAWAPDSIVVDEVHRTKTWTSRRSEVVRGLAASVTGPRLAISGTPLLASPAELAPALAITGHLDAVFGGADSYLST
ncbi:SNF2-related protein, partial [Cutibacterium acnes]